MRLVMRFVSSMVVAIVLINGGGAIADHFELTRTTSIFWGGVLYMIFSVATDVINAALPSQNRGAKS